MPIAVSPAKISGLPGSEPERQGTHEARAGAVLARHCAPDDRGAAAIGRVRARLGEATPNTRNLLQIRPRVSGAASIPAILPWASPGYAAGLHLTSCSALQQMRLRAETEHGRETVSRRKTFHALSA